MQMLMVAQNGEFSLAQVTRQRKSSFAPFYLCLVFLVPHLSESKVKVNLFIVAMNLAIQALRLTSFQGCQSN